MLGEKAYFGSILQPCNIWPQSDNLKKPPSTVNSSVKRG